MIRMSTPPSTNIPVGERFIVQELLGRGAAGAVYRAYDRERDATVALKVLSENTPGSLVRFKHEFRALSCFVHPNVVHLYELITRNDQWLLTMELIEGTDLLSYVRPPPGLPSPPPDATPGSTTESWTATESETSRGIAGSPEVGEVPSLPPAGSPQRSRSSRRAYGELDEERLRHTLRQLCVTGPRRCWAWARFRSACSMESRAPVPRSPSRSQPRPRMIMMA